MAKLPNLPCVRVKVHFYSKLAEQKQWKAIYPPFFGCLFKLNDVLYECRAYFEDEGIVYPGTERTFKIYFLRPERAISNLHVGINFQLKLLEIVGDGVVLELPTPVESLQSADDQSQD
jgi:hypothetical protein